MRETSRWLWIIFAILIGITLIGEISYAIVIRKNWTNFSKVNGEKIENVEVVTLAPDGAIWVGTSNPARMHRIKGEEWQTFSSDGALSEDRITAIAVRKEGTFWVGTNQGLYYFDGKSWTPYTKDDGLAGNIIEEIAFPSDGSVWVSILGTSVTEVHGNMTSYYTEEGGVSSFDGYKWTSYSEADGLEGEHASSIGVTQDGNIWVGMNFDGVFSFNGETWTTQTTRSVEELTVAPNGHVWVSGVGGGGVSCFDGQRWINYSTDDGLAGDRVSSITNTTDGAIWFGINKNDAINIGISRFNGSTWTTYKIPFSKAGINSIETDGHDRLWVGTKDGLYVLDPAEQSSPFLSIWTYVRIVLGGSALFALVILGGNWLLRKSKRIEEVQVSKVDKDEGVDVDIQDKKPSFTLNRLLWIAFAVLIVITVLGEIYSRQGLKEWSIKNEIEIHGEKINKYLISEKDGFIWVGPEGIYEFDGELIQEYSRLNVLAERNTRAIATTLEGYLWVGTDDGIYIYNGVGWTSIDETNGPTDEYINKIEIAPDGQIWVGTANGVFTFDGQTWNTYLGGTVINNLIIGPNGTVWVVPASCTDGCLYSFDGKKWTEHTHIKSKSYPPIPILVDKEDLVWVGGIRLYSYDGENWIDHSGAEDFAGGHVNEIAISNDGTLWVGTENGASHFNGETWSSYDANDGLIGNNIESIAFTSDGAAWFGVNGALSNQGISRYYRDTWTTFYIPQTDRKIYSMVADDQDNIIVRTSSGELVILKSDDLKAIQKSTFSVYWSIGRWVGIGSTVVILVIIISIWIIRTRKSIEIGSNLEIALYVLLLLAGLSIVGFFSSMTLIFELFYETGLYIFIGPALILPSLIIVPATLLLIYLNILKGSNAIRLRILIWLIIFVVVFLFELFTIQSGRDRSMQTIYVMYGGYLVILTIIPFYWLRKSWSARRPNVAIEKEVPDKKV